MSFTTKPVIILGTGGNCVDILDTMDDINNAFNQPVYKCIGFLDDNPEKHGQFIEGVPIIGSLGIAPNFPDCFFVNGIGSSKNFLKKKEIIAASHLSDEQFITIIHPTASISRMASLGKGVVVFQNAVITSNVFIGNHVMILPTTIISHNSVVKDYTIFSGGVCVSGNVSIGESCYLGTNCAVRDGIKIGNNVLVGMGSVVVKDIPDNVVVMGNPAKISKSSLV